MAEDKMPWDARVGLALSILLFAIVLAELFGDWTTAKDDTKLGILVLLALLPFAASFKGFGFEFVRRTAQDAEAFRDVHAKLDDRLTALEKRVPDAKPGSPTFAKSKSETAPSIPPAQAQATILEMLSDRAYNMRSQAALEQRTGLQGKALTDALAAIPDVVPVQRADTGQVFYGFRARVKAYMERHGSVLPEK